MSHQNSADDWSVLTTIENLQGWVAATRLQALWAKLQNEYASGNFNSDSNRAVVDLASEFAWDPKEVTPADRKLMSEAAHFTIEHPAANCPDQPSRARAILEKIRSFEAAAATQAAPLTRPAELSTQPATSSPAN